MICTKCGVDLPDSSFSRASRNTNRRFLHCWCTPCVVANNRERRQRDPAHARALANKDQHRKKVKKYGLTVDDYAAMLAGQDGVCAICRKPERVPERRLAIDHNHTTGKVRGLLCFACNAAIGKFGDDPHILVRAAAYLVNSVAP